MGCTDREAREAIQGAKRLLADRAGYSKAELHKEMLLDQEQASSRPAAGRIGRTGRHRMQVSLKAVMAAVTNEGPEVLTKDADGYWDDQRRRCPWTDPSPDSCIPTVRKLSNRYGRVISRTIFHSDGTKTELKVG